MPRTEDAPTRERHPRSKDRPARIWRPLVALLVVAGVGIGGWALARSWLFSLEGIELRGNHALPRSQILAASGLHTGMNMLAVDPKAVVIRLEALPLVRRASVERIYPSKIRITIEERTAAVIIDTTSGAWLADQLGVLISRAPSTAPALPRVKVNAAVGSVGLADALRLWSRLPSTQRGQVGTIDAVNPGALAAVMDGVRVVFGTPDDVQAKVDAVSSVLEWAKSHRRRVASIDVRVPSRPAAVFA